MSKILIEFDTVSKSAKASIDGKDVADFSSASVHKHYCCYDDAPDEDPKFGCYVESSTENKDEGMRMSTLTSASLKEATKTVVYASDVKPVSESIVEFFAKHSK